VCARGRAARPRSPLNWLGGRVLPTELHGRLRILRENTGPADGMRRASFFEVRIVSRAANSESSGSTGVSATWSPGLTNHCAKTYPSAAACDRRGRRRPLGSLLPSRSQANQCQGRRLSKEFFQ
jgi:hypothetical protein